MEGSDVSGLVVGLEAAAEAVYHLNFHGVVLAQVSSRQGQRDQPMSPVKIPRPEARGYQPLGVDYGRSSCTSHNNSDSHY